MQLDVRLTSLRSVIICRFVTVMSTQRAEVTFSQGTPSLNVKLFMYPNLIAMWVGPNDTISTADSDVELN